AFVKYDSAGNLIWGKEFGGSSFCNVNAAKVDNRNCVVAAGYYTNFIDIDPDTSLFIGKTTNPTNYHMVNDTGAFIARYSPQGSLIWGSFVNGPGHENIVSLDITSQNEVLAIGYFSDSVQFVTSGTSTTLKSKGEKDIFIIKYDSTGKILSLLQLGGIGNDRGTSIQSLPSNEMLLAGSFSDTLNLGLNTTRQTVISNGKEDFFYAHYDSNNSLIAFNAIGGRKIDIPSDVKFGHNGQYYLAGTFISDTIDFDPTSNNAFEYNEGKADAFIASYTKKGQLRWAKRFGDNSNETIFNFRLDANDQMTFVGTMTFNHNFNPGGSGGREFVRGSAGYICVYDSAGKYQSHKVFHNGMLRDLEFLDTHKIAYVGYCFGEADLDFGPGADTFYVRALTSTGRNSFFTIYKPYYDLVKGWSNEMFSESGISFLDVLPADSGHVIVSGFIANNQSLDVKNHNPIKTWNDGDPFLAKYDSLNNLIWFRVFNDRSNTTSLKKIALDSKGNIIIHGTYRDSVDLDPGPGKKIYVAKRWYNIFLLKLDRNGKYVWSKSYEDDEYDTANDLQIDKNDEIVIAGNFKSDLRFNPRSSAWTATDMDYYLIRLDKDGKFISGHYSQGVGKESIEKIIIGRDRSIYCLGYFTDSFDIDPSSKTQMVVGKIKYVSYYFIAKFDSLGQLSWYKILNNNKPFQANQIELDNKDDLYVTGRTADSTNFNIGGKANWIYRTYYNDFIAKYNHHNGKNVWAKAYDTWAVYQGNNPFQIIDDEIYLVYNYPLQRRIDFDFHPIRERVLSQSHSTTLMAVYDTSATLQDIYTFGNFPTGFSPKSMKSIGQQLYIAGLNNSSLDIDLRPNKRLILPSNGYRSGTLLKYQIVPKCNRSFSTMNVRDCKEFTSPSNKYIYTKSGLYQDTFTAANGCDSIIRISFTNTTTFSILSVGSCSTYKTPNGKLLSATGTYYDTLTNSQNCDSIITIVFTKYAKSNSSIFVSQCKPYLSLSKRYTYTKSGIYTDTIISSNGCDSIVTINLTILEATSGKITVSACHSYTSPSGKYTYASTGIYSDTLMNSNGCDSIVTINLTILEATSGKITVSACHSYTSSSGKYTYASTGIYSDTLMNSNGCDSIVTI
ncbi:MAG: hypothetical protein KDC92_14455, partial [Bacteroidetes bacterium]|nr:hypothetical protein [Bacteroidota bacterium]